MRSDGHGLCQVALVHQSVLWNWSAVHDFVGVQFTTPYPLPMPRIPMAVLQYLNITHNMAGATLHPSPPVGPPAASGSTGCHTPAPAR